MAILGWVCGGLVLLVVAGYLLLALVLAPIQERKNVELAARIEKDGTLVYCQIVLANPGLYKAKDTSDYSYAQVVYTTSDVPNREERLLQVAAKLTAFRAEGDTKEERVIASVMTSQIPYFTALRLPERVAGDIEAYTVSVRVYWNRLPGRRLTRDYIWCKVLDGEDDNVRMTDDPDRPAGW